MKISSKGRYAVRIMAELGKNTDKVISASSLAESQEISMKYLEQILKILVAKNLVKASRGATGGYSLVKKPEEYSIADILAATGDLPQIAPCLSERKCARESICSSVKCWEKLNKLILDYLKSITLRDLS